MASITGGVKITGFISPTDTTDTYAVIDPVYGVDGLRNLNSIAERDAITAERKRQGMIVGVKNGSVNDYYVLNSAGTWNQIQMVTGLTWDLGTYDLTLNTFGGEITRNLSILASDVTVTGGTYSSTTGVVSFSSNTTGSRTGLYYAGNWSALSSYTSSTIVTYTVNGLDYYAIANVGPSATPPTGDTTNWRSLSSRGTFSVSGFTSGYTNIYTTAATYNQTSGEIPLSFTDPSKNLTITGVTSIYGKDDSIKSNRIVDLNQKTLNFSSSTAPNTLTISTGGTVGIGVSSGTTKLHISAATDPIRIQGIAASSDSNVLTIDTSGVVHTISVASLSSTLTTLYTGNGTLNSDRIVDLSNKSLSFSSSTYPDALMLSGGNIGIGTLSAPGAGKLAIQTPNNTYAIEIRDSIGNNHGGLLFESDSDLILSLQNSSGIETIKLHPSGNTFFNGGNVGIGTSTPQHPFHVVTSASTLRYEHDVAGGSFSISGNSGIPRFDIGSDAGDVFSFGIVATGTAATYANRGKARDAFVRASAASNGLNIINAAGSSTEDYIRFYAGKNADQGLPDLHINGSGTTRGFVGIGVSAATNVLHVSATTNPVKIEGLTAVSATTILVATNSSNELVNFSGTVRSIPYFSSAGNSVITHSPTFTYSDGLSRILQLDDGDLSRSSSITFAGGRGSITAPAGVGSGLILQAGLSSPFDQTKFITLRNGLTNYVSFTTVGVTGGDSAHTATFSSTVSMNISGIRTPNWGLSGIATRVLSNNYVDSTTASTTAGETVASSFAIPTFTALTGRTYSALTNVYIAGAPVAGTNVTGLTSYALKVNTGTTYFGGDVTLSGISSGNTAQVLTRQTNGNIAFRNSSDFGFGNVVGNAGATLYWYDENNTPPATLPVATGTGSIAFGNLAEALAGNMFVAGEAAGRFATGATSSIFMGDSAGSDSDDSIFSIMLGYLAGQSSRGSSNSNFIGNGAGNGSTGSTNSNFIGLNAGAFSTASTFSNFIGNNAGNAAPAGTTNSVFIGTDAGARIRRVSKSPDRAVFIGLEAGSGATDDEASVMISARAGKQSSGSTVSVFIGQDSGGISTGASESVYIGHVAGYQTRAAQGVNFIGANAGRDTVATLYANFIGYNVGRNVSAATDSNFIGRDAGRSTSGSTQSNFIGYQAGSGATSTTNSTFLGFQSGFGARNGNNNFFAGNLSGYQSSGTTSNVFIGMDAGYQILASNVIAIGEDSGFRATSATSSVFLGKNAGSGATQAEYSFFVGEDAGKGATSGFSSMFIGYKAGENSRSAQTSVFIGQYAGQSATTDNGGIISIGHEAGQTTNNLTYGVALGYQAANAVSNGRQGVFIGYQAGQDSVQTTSSVIIGGLAGRGTTGASAMSAVMIGPSAGRLAHRATNSVFIGNLAGELAGSADTAVFIGSAAGRSSTGASQSIFIGQQAGSQTNNVTSIMIGAGAGNQARGANGCVIIGFNAGQIATGATNSIFIGDQAGDSARNATQSIMIGVGSGVSAFTSSNSVLAGWRAGYQASGATSTTNLVLIGHEAGYQLLDSSSIVAIGADAAYQISSTTQSVMIGNNAGLTTTSVGSSVFVGQSAGSSANNSSNSTFVGTSAGANATNASGSVFLGLNSGNGAISSSNSTFVGSSAGNSATGSSSTIMVGSFAGQSTTNATNSIFIGNRAGSGTTNSSGNIIIGNGITMSAGSTNRICIGGVIFGVNANSATSGVITSAVTDGAVSIGVIQPHPSAILDLTSTSKGFLPPRVGATALPSTPTKGLVVHADASGSTPNRRYAGLQLYDGTIWRTINPYKRFVAVVEINSGNNIVGGYPVILENELNTTINVTYDTTSKVIVINAPSGSPFTTDKTAIFATCGMAKTPSLSGGTNFGYMVTNIPSTSTIEVAKAINSTTLYYDYNTVIEIRVYD